MEIVAILRLLRRRWPWLLPGVALAVLAGLSAVYRVSPSGLESRTVSGGSASGRVLIAALDAPAFNLDSDVSGSLTNRAVMLSNLMGTDALREDIARRAGVAPKDLVVFGPAAGTPEFPVPIAIKSTEAALVPRQPYTATVAAAPLVPIITVRASAPEAAQAAKVVDAVRAAMEQVVKVRSGENQAIAVERMGPVASRTIVKEPGKALAVIAFVLVLAVWASTLVVMHGVLRYVRASRRRGARPAAA